MENTRQKTIVMERIQAKQPSIDTLIAALDSDDGMTRQRARYALVSIGEPAVPALIKALGSHGRYTHWEAVKALSQIGSPQAAQALVTALEDNDFGIRWLAAEGLIAIGYAGLAPLLLALMQRSDSIRLREGAHHVLHDLVSQGSLDDATRPLIVPVLEALNEVEPAVVVPLVAQRALLAL